MLSLRHHAASLGLEGSDRTPVEQCPPLSLGGRRGKLSTGAAPLEAHRAMRLPARSISRKISSAQLGLAQWGKPVTFPQEHALDVLLWQHLPEATSLLGPPLHILLPLPL
jgi:hypothetical protein